MNWGRKYKLFLEYKTKEDYKIIPRCAELFDLKTKIFTDDTMFQLGSSWIFDHLMSPILNQLTERNVISIYYEDIEYSHEVIRFLSENEIEEYTVSPLCTSLSSSTMEISYREKESIWEYIREKIKYKNIIIKKINEEIISINSTIPCF